MKRYILYCLPLLLLLSCQTKEDLKITGYNGPGGGLMEMEQEMMPITRQEEVAPPPPPVPEKDFATQGRNVEKKIIKDGSMGIRVEELESAKLSVDSLLNLSGAYYASENLHKSRFEISYSLTIRVPYKQFELLVDNLLDGIGELQYKNVDARDVTAEFIDLETRLSNKRTYLERYKEILKKANSVKDILTIENEIRKIEEEIESAEGRLNYLSDQVKFSTLNLELSQEQDYVYVPAKKDRFIERLKASLSGGWNGFVSFVLFLLRLWPFMLIMAILLWWWMRRRRQKRSALTKSK